MKKKYLKNVMTIEYLYEDGSSESSTDDAYKIRKRFADFVSYACSNYMDYVREVRLIDCAGRVFRSFKQFF